VVLSAACHFGLERAVRGCHPNLSPTQMRVIVLRRRSIVPSKNRTYPVTYKLPIRRAERTRQLTSTSPKAAASLDAKRESCTQCCFRSGLLLLSKDGLVLLSAAAVAPCLFNYRGSKGDSAQPITLQPKRSRYTRPSRAYCSLNASALSHDVSCYRWNCSTLAFRRCRSGRLIRSAHVLNLLQLVQKKGTDAIA
jgi:hypothetical protein